MATASPSTKPSHLICPICEEAYNERDHLPKGFPCQHSVCMRCLEGIIEQCDGDEVACPLCRQTVPIPQSKAAGFPNNLLILELLCSMQSQVEVAPSTCTQHNKILSVFCLTCQKAVCMTCAFKSPEHRGHDWEELSEAMEKCIHQSEEVLSDIIQTASTFQEKIKQRAQANNPQCLQFLCQLQKCQEYVRNASVGDIDDIPTTPNIPAKVCTENPVEEASALTPVDDLPTASLPQSKNKDKLEPLASAMLPEFKYIDINRRNRLLLTFPHSRYATYKIIGHQFSTMEQPALSDKTMRMLKDAEHAILSQDSKLVVQDEFSMMCHNKTYSFRDRYLCKVHTFRGKWMTLCHRTESELLLEIIWENDERTIHEEEGLSLDSLVSFS